MSTHFLALLAPVLTAAGFAICEGAPHLRERTGGRLGTQATRIIAVPFFVAAGWCASPDPWGPAFGGALAIGIWTEKWHGEGMGAETASDETYLFGSGWTRLYPAMLVALAKAAAMWSIWPLVDAGALAWVASYKPWLWANSKNNPDARFWRVIGWIAQATDLRPGGGLNEYTRRAAIVFGGAVGIAAAWWGAA